jgi:sugar (pentulose or hexulose) kinase
MPLRTPDTALVAGWDFSTGSVKALAFDLAGRVLAECRLPTDLHTDGGVSELNLMQLEGQARASYRGLVAQLRQIGRDQDLLAAGISATHHTAGRIDADGNQVRRAICWNDQTLAAFHAEGLERLGGQQRAIELTGGPWAVRYSLSHLVKDEHALPEPFWASHTLQHGSLAAGYLTGQFHVCSVSAAASTGLLDLRTGRWRREMLDALRSADHRQAVWERLPKLLMDNEPVGTVADHLAGPTGPKPRVFPTLDDQAAGLVGGGAVDPGQLAVILGNSAVVNSSSDRLPAGGTLDAMRLNHGPYLWMRCFSNGAQFLDRVVGPRADWPSLEAAARAVPPGCGGVGVLPFVLSEPSIGLTAPRFEWYPQEPADPGVRVRAAFEAIAHLIALGVKEHQAAGQAVTRVSVSGGIARSDLMVEILAAVLNRPLDRLESAEGPALGAAVAALAGLETKLRCDAGDPARFPVADAVATLVRFRPPVTPRADWATAYAGAADRFAARLNPPG